MRKGFCLPLRVRQRRAGDGLGPLHGGQHLRRALRGAAGGVEVGTQVDLLAYDEELVDDLNSR